MMIYLVLDVHSAEHTDKCDQVNAWINTINKSDAMSIISKELSAQGWVVSDIIEASNTNESDYFPPCKSFDAYNEAKKGVFALRFFK